MATVDTRRAGTVDPLAPVEHQGAGPWPGVGPGLVGGLTMLVILCILSVARRQGLFAPVHLIAATALGPAALAGGKLATVVGLAIHFLTSALFGMLFTQVVGRTTQRRALGLGMGYGILIWGIAQFIALPLLLPEVAAHFGVVWPFFLGHLGFGLMLGASVPTVYEIDGPQRRYLDPLHHEIRP